jgi:hypothetical protein
MESEVWDNIYKTRALNSKQNHINPTHTLIHYIFAESIFQPIPESSKWLSFLQTSQAKFCHSSSPYSPNLSVHLVFLQILNEQLKL